MDMDMLIGAGMGASFVHTVLLHRDLQAGKAFTAFDVVTFLAAAATMLLGTAYLFYLMFGGLFR